MTTVETAEKGDLLSGLKAIAIYLGITPRQAKYLIERGRLPFWREGNIIFARRSSLIRWMTEREDSGGDPPRPRLGHKAGNA